jgi:hypothetical protein
MYVGSGFRGRVEGWGLVGSRGPACGCRTREEGLLGDQG